MKYRLFFVILIFSSCGSDFSDIKKFSLESTFHGNSSKIWVINKVKQKGVNYSALQLKEKDVAIFFESGKILIQPLKTLGTYPSKTGTLKLSENNESCEFHFPKETWRFNIVELNSKSVKLKKTKESDFPYDLELIAYPEN